MLMLRETLVLVLVLVLVLISVLPAQLLPTSSSSFLRAGSRFTGTQQSDRQVYEVQVELKHVDMSQSFLCGYLRIKGKIPSLAE